MKKWVVTYNNGGYTPVIDIYQDNEKGKADLNRFLSIAVVNNKDITFVTVSLVTDDSIRKGE